MPWWEIGLRLLMACLVSGVIGWDREVHHRPAGIRTHILVCVGAAVVAITESLLVEEVVALNQSAGFETGITLSRTRFLCQVISGIGFLGAGTIFISQKRVAGLTTAASLWITGCLGLVCGCGYYLLALACTVICILTLSVMQRFLVPRYVRRIAVTFTERDTALPAIQEIFTKYDVRVHDTDMEMRARRQKVHYVFTYTLEVPAKLTFDKVLTDLAACPGILRIRSLKSKM